MSNALPNVLAGLAVAASIFVGLTAEVLIMAGMANSSPAQLRNLKIAMLAIAVGVAATTTVAIFVMARHHAWAAAIVGIAPAVVLVVLFAVLLITG